MPGKYLEYIRAGKYVVPVELAFLPFEKKDVFGDTEVLTSKWVEKDHWKEIKAMLKPAVELVTKYNDSETQKISKSHHVAFGQDIGLGYIIHLNKEKCPFHSILDPKKNCWTDDEDDMLDENSDFDFGGRHKNYTPTKCYIKVCVLRKTDSQVEDGKRIKKELGVKSDDMRSYFQSTTSPTTSTALTSVLNKPAPGHSKHHKPKKVKKVTKKKKDEDHQKQLELRRELSSSEESLMDLPHAGYQLPIVWQGLPSTPPLTTLHSNEVNASKPKQPSSTENLSLDLDLDLEIERTSGRGGIFSDSAVDDVFSSSSLFRNWIDDDDDEELPDIEEDFIEITKARKPPGGRRKRRSDRSPRRRRNVAIVEPMKHSQLSFEEAVGAMTVPVIQERKRRGRSAASPTLERLLGSGSRSRHSNSNCAIEFSIIGDDDEELLPIFQETPTPRPAGRRSRRDGSSRGRRRKPPARRVDRLTPSPPVEDDLDEADGNLASHESDSDSDLQMPVLKKMVPSPSSPPDEYFNQNSPPEFEILELQTPLPEFHINVKKDIPRDYPESSSSSNAARKPRRSPSPDITEQFSSPPRIVLRKVSNNAPSMSGSPSRKRVRQRASDSDDITSEAAYRKNPLPIKKKKRRKLLPKITSSQRNSCDAAVQTNGISAERNINPSPIPPSPTPATAISSEQDLSETSPEFPRVKIVNPAVIMKIERLENTQGDQDHAPSQYSDISDDDEVLFAGQYQAIPVLTIDSPKRSGDDDEEEDLFSFERPASVKIETQSTNSDPVPSESGRGTPLQESVSTASQTQAEKGEYCFDFAERVRTAGAKKAFGVFSHVDQENDMNMMMSPSRVPAAELEVEVVADHNENYNDDDDHHHIPVERLSTFQLLNHPNTLRGGFGVLSKVMSSPRNSETVYREFGLVSSSKQKEDGARENSEDSELMPPPPSKRALSPDITSFKSKSERKILLSKAAKKKFENGNRPDSPVPGPSSGIRSSMNIRSSLLSNSSDDGEDDGYNCQSAAEPYFREILSRSQEGGSNYEPQGDEYDLNQDSQCMLTVVRDYAEKSRTYKMHERNIENMTSEELEQCFEQIKAELFGIFEGSVESVRNKLFHSKQHHGNRMLRGLQIVRPFPAEHHNTLHIWLRDMLLPHAESTLKCTDYINYVMRPEAFIRIYAMVNDISFSTAEKEMLAGPCYEGPYLDS